MGRPASPLREAEIQTAVLAHWRALGVPGSLVAAIPNARAHGQAGLTAGLPDLLILGGAVRIGFLELKRDGGRISAHQAAFVALCQAIGIPCEITFGRDAPIMLLERWGVVRGRRAVA